MSELHNLPRVFIATTISVLLTTAEAAALPASPTAGARAQGELRLRLVPPDQAGVDLGRLSFTDVSALIEGAQAGGELVLPMPFAGSSSFAPIEVREVEVALDEDGKALVLAGSAVVLGRGGRVFLSGTYAGSGPGQYAFGVSPDTLVLGEWFPALASTPLARVKYAKAGLVVASAAHTLPSSTLVASVLGIEDPGEELKVQPGVGLRATLAVETMPVVGEMLAALGIEQAELRQSGRIGSDADLLVAALEKKKDLPIDLELHSRFEATSMKGLQQRLPPWIKPTSFGPSLDLTLKTSKDRSKVEKLVTKLTQQVKLEVAGESIDFTLSAEVDTNLEDAKVTLTGTRGWEHPLGIGWLDRAETTLELVVDSKAARAGKTAKEELKATLSSSIKIGSAVAALEFHIEGEEGKKDELKGHVTARLERLTIGDLASFVSIATGSSFLSDLELGDAAALDKVSLTLKHEKEKDTLEVAATAGLAGQKADVLFVVSRPGGRGAGAGKSTSKSTTESGGTGGADPLFVIRRLGGRMSDLASSLSGKAGDLEFPESLWTLTPSRGGASSSASASSKSGGSNKAGGSRTLSSADLGPTAREFFRGVYGSDFRVELQPGIHFGATLPLAKLPPALVRALDVRDTSGSLLVEGSLAMSFDFASGRPSGSVEELVLHAELAGATLQGLTSRLPGWIRPTKLAPSLDLTYSSGAGLVLALGLDAAVEIARESRPFRISAQLDATGEEAELVLRGETTGAWERPLGIDWLSLPSASLVVSGAGKELNAKLSSTIRIGAQEARLDLVLDSDGAGHVETRLDSLTIGDLAAFVAERTGSSFLRDLRLGDAARLENVVLTMARAQKKNSLELAATVALGNAKADLLLALAGSGSGKVEPLLAIRRGSGRLSDLVPSLSGKPVDLSFPTSVFTLNPTAGAKPTKRSSADLGPAARRFFEGVYGPGDFELELEPGIRFGATLPVSKLPTALVQALGIQEADASLFLEGSLAMSFDLGAGRPSADVQALELSAVLPRTAGASARLRAGLPAWMRLDASSQRTLTVRYAAPSSVTFLKTNDVLADLDGQTRHFRISTEVSADAKQGHAKLSGSLVGEWKQPFGLKALNLRDVQLAAAAQATAGSSGRSSGALTLEGGFDLGPKRGRMRLELGAATGQGVSGSFTGTLDSLALEDLARIELLPNAPGEGLERLRSTLGKLPPLLEPTLHVALGKGQPSVSFRAHTDVRGARAHLLVFVGKGKSGPQAIVALRPESFSLAKLFPALAQNPTVAPLANLSLDRFGLFAVLGDLTLSGKESQPEVREFCAGVTGESEEDFELNLSAGLNLEARLAADQLPQELKQALQRLNQTMGRDSPGSLSLRGTIGASLHEMRLAAALPPLRPARAPKWLKSGELAFVLTGTPSFMLTATLVVDCEGDLLNLSVEGGVERQGANVAIALKSALQADEAWTSPFGQEWLEIRRFSGQLSIDALANIGFGGGGDVTIGSKDIDVFAWTKINSATGVPMGLVVKGESKAGLALRDLADLQGKMRTAAGAGGPKLLPLDKLPDVALRDFALLIATRAVPEEGIDSPGFRLKGDMYIPLKPGATGTKMLAVDCGVSKEGILAKGFLGAYQVGPLRWEDSYVDLEATLAAQHLLVHGRVELLGSSSETDLQLSREKFSFEATREIHGLGKAQLFVESKFDLAKPTFRARGQLDDEFGKTFGDSALGELTDVTGKAAGIGAAALGAYTGARGRLEAAREEAGLPTALETIDAIAAQRVREAQAAADEHKRDMDAKWKAWQDTPTSEPVRRAARKLAWEQSKFTYEEGPLSKINVLERRKAQYHRVHAGVAALEAAKAENERVQAALGSTLDEIAAHKGKTVVVTSASFESSLEGLMALKDGLPVNMRLELLFCGKPRTVDIPWIVGKPADNAKRVVATLIPAVSRLVNG